MILNGSQNYQMLVIYLLYCIRIFRGLTVFFNRTINLNYLIIKLSFCMCLVHIGRILSEKTHKSEGDEYLFYYFVCCVCQSLNLWVSFILDLCGCYLSNFGWELEFLHFLIVSIFHFECIVQWKEETNSGFVYQTEGKTTFSSSYSFHSTSVFAIGCDNYL